MADRPIIFSAPMVRALLDGRKTQTRRLLTAYCDEAPAFVLEGGITALDENDQPYRWPRTKAVGDRLYVREAHYLTDDGDTEYAVFAEDQASIAEHIENMHRIMASHPQIDWSKHLRLRPSIHMPRWASRLTLTVTDVRVQRLQDISGEDVVAEGACEFALLPPTHEETLEARALFRTLWNSLHGPDAWDTNPWVSAITFTVEKGNIDD